MDKSNIQTEIQFKAIRSSGPGGQHVNKVASKVELYFDIQNSQGLTSREKEIITTKLANKISKNGQLLLYSQESRSQHKNKEIVTQQLFQLLTSSLVQPKKRRSTKPTRSSLVKKAKNKQKHSLKKQLRRKPNLD
ncbi:alternative ribosome rescue aminoacyl-tRNA hydrolase ArfB [Tenacibaculum sp. 190524A05c]|uniref:alternative ribosome rescue aminoacyl-tRNA hydrolase ArfB n=1 Tax=Tenacibaculum platacis TaxID=3137852 RepID=UPI0032B22E25